MRFFVGITDRDWFDFLSRIDGLDEVNFWQPSGQQQFRALQIGEPFLFRAAGRRGRRVVGACLPAPRRRRSGQRHLLVKPGWQACLPGAAGAEWVSTVWSPVSPVRKCKRGKTRSRHDVEEMGL